MPVIISEDRRWRAHFESVGEVQDFLAVNPSKWAPRDRGADCKSMRAESSWDLGAGYEGVQRLARTGWSEGALDVAARLGSRLPARERTARWRHDMAGELPDVVRHLAGQPDSMKRRGHDNSHRPVVSLFVNVWIRCDVRAKAMANYGAALVAMIDQLENSGKRVELTAGVVAPHCHTITIMSATWTVKRAQDPVDLGALAFSLAHPGASRRFGWAVWERSDKQPDSGFGRGVGYKATEADLIDPAPGTFILTGLNSDPRRCQTMNDAIKFVAAQINEAAGEQLVDPEDLYVA